MGCNGTKQEAPANKGGGGGGQGDRDKEKKENKATNQHYQQAMTFLTKVKLLQRLPAEDLPMVAQAMVSKSFKAGDTIFEQGDSGADFYIIRSGEAKVTIDGTDVANLKEGEYFGERALLREEARAATIKASSPLETLTLSREQFRSLGLPDKLVFANRNAVGAGAVQAAEAKPPTPKTDADKDFIAKALKANVSLAGVVTLDDARISKLIEVAWKEEHPKGKELITEADPNADYFYIVAEGEFAVSNKTSDASGEESTNLLTKVQIGGSFGELALLYLTPRAATVMAQTAAVVWVIDRTNFKNILMQVSSKKVAEYAKMLENLQQLNASTEEERMKVAKAMVEMHYSKDEIILQQGESGSTFYVLYEGQVAIIVDGKQVESLNVQKGSTPKFFGEKALLNEEKRAATVKVVSETAKALALDKRTFDRVLKPMKDIMLEQTAAAGGRRASIERKHLKRIGLLGCGGFGAVELYEHVNSKETYAMKALSKGYIVKTGMQESVMNEKNILMMTNSEFIIKLFETFNGQQSLYFLLEPALGGELYATYNRKGFHGSEKHAKFYVAGVVFAFEHCHERHIIYRDLKPENLLLTEHGAIKLTDMASPNSCWGRPSPRAAPLTISLQRSSPLQATPTQWIGGRSASSCSSSCLGDHHSSRRTPCRPIPRS